MSSLPLFISLEHDRWRIVCNQEPVVIYSVGFDRSAGPLSVINELASELENLGYGGQEICLGLYSGRVQSAQIDCDGLPRKGRQQMMLYRLEEQLMLAAEELTAVYLPPKGGRCLGLAVVSSEILEIIQKLSSAGIEVGPICPAALLSLWICLQSREENPNYVILSGSDRIELFRITDGLPHDWYSPADQEQLLHSLRINLLNHPIEGDNALALVAGPLGGDTLSALEDELSIQKIPIDDEFFATTAAQGGELLLAGKPAGWIDFRIGKLACVKKWGRAGGLLKTAGILALILVVVLTAAFISRGIRYGSLASDYKIAQKKNYHQLYPNAKIPTNITSRLESELRRLSGVLGQGQNVPKIPKALDDLYDVLTNLPRKIRLRILRLQLAPAEVVIKGQVKSHTDAEAIGQSLRKGGLDALAPRTERIASGDVSFTITAKPALDKSDIVIREAK